MPVAGAPATPGELETALTRWRAALGPEHVLTDEAFLAKFTDPYSPADFGYRTTAVLQPGSVRDVRAVVRIAAETGVRVWAQSRGRDNGYGGSAPCDPDTVVVNPRREDQGRPRPDRHPLAGQAGHLVRPPRPHVGRDDADVRVDPPVGADSGMSGMSRR